ncbi:hypothetical protein FRC07_003214, partial [Ceratobasidium sp. 392]
MPTSSPNRQTGLSDEGYSEEGKTSSLNKGVTVQPPEYSPTGGNDTVNLNRSPEEVLGDIKNIPNLKTAFTTLAGYLDTRPSGQPPNSMNHGYYRRLRDRLTDGQPSPSNEQPPIAINPSVDDPMLDYIPQLRRIGIFFLRESEGSRVTADLDRALDCFETAASRISDLQSEKPRLLHDIATTFMYRFENSGRIEDLNAAISYEESSVVLTADDDIYLPEQRDQLVNLLYERYTTLRNLLNEQALSLVSHNDPEKSARLATLGLTLLLQFRRSKDRHDIDKAIVILEECVQTTGDNDTKKPERLSHLGQSQTECVSQIPDGRREKPMYIRGLGVTYLARFEYLGDAADLDQAILHRSQAVLAASDGHPRMPRLLENLSIVLVTRANQRGDISDCDEAITHLKRAAELEVNNDVRKAQILRVIGNALSIKWFKKRNNSDLDEAIHYHELAVQTMPVGHLKRRHCLNSLSGSLKYWGYTKKQLPDINRSVALIKETITLTPPRHQDYLAYAKNLGDTLSNRYEITKDPADSDKFKKALIDAVHTPVASPNGRLQAARDLLETATKLGLPPSLDVYQLTFDLLPLAVWLGKSVDRRYQDIFLIGGLASSAVAAAISLERNDLALEWLEQGRSVVWNQTLQLRTPLDDLRRVDPLLTGRLEEVSAALDKAGLAPGATQSTGDANQAQRRLAGEWDELVNQARNIPNCQDFLRPHKASTLARAAHSEAVVVQLARLLRALKN